MEIEAFKDVPVTEGTDPQQIRLEEIEAILSQDLIKGYFMQFGVYEGFSLRHMASLRPKQHWHGFDSFEGLPESWDTGKKLCKKGKFALKSPPEMPGNVSLEIGLFQDTLPPFVSKMDGVAAFIDIDCDLYDSTIDVLFELNDKIVPGTVIRFDELCDWRVLGWVPRGTRITHYTTWKDHEWKALNDWMVKFNRTVEPVYRSVHMAGTVLVTQ